MVLTGKAGLTDTERKSFSYFKDGRIRELGHSVTFPFCLPSFRCFVSHVVCLISKEQVFRVHAWRVIAFMKHECSLWNRSDEDSVTRNMGIMAFPMPKREHTVTKISSDTTDPQPAAGLVYLNFLHEVSQSNNRATIPATTIMGSPIDKMHSINHAVHPAIASARPHGRSMPIQCSIGQDRKITESLGCHIFNHTEYCNT